MAGCAAKDPELAPTDIPDSKYAYVTGRYDFFTGSSTWERRGSEGEVLEKVEIGNKGYKVYRLTPGRYTIYQACEAGKSVESDTGLAWFDTAPGKVTYIGDIRLTIDPFALSAKDNSRAAKEYIKASYPNLENDLDELLVFSPPKSAYFQGK